MPYVVAKYIPQSGEYRCGVEDCNKVLFTGEIIHGRVEKQCKCGMKNVVDNPVRQYGAYQDNLNLVKKHR